MLRNFLLLAAGAGALCGCATAVPPALPVTQFAPLDCGTAADLSAAVPLLPEKNRPIWSVNRPIDDSSACLEWEGVRGPYLVFSLPEVESGFIEELGAGGTWRGPIEIGGLLEPARLFSPHIAILDANGQQLRTFTPDQYLVRGNLYSVQFQPQAGERFVLVTSNPVRVGTSYEGIRTSTATTSYYTGFGASYWTSGIESRIASGFSYFGNVIVNVYRPVEAE